jgi:eukaryotic-like serine/threonine-protein kinase
MSLSSLQPGAVFAGRYRIVRAIARGGMGAVYEVVHLETHRRRALKVILPGVLESEEMRRRFQLEAQVAARIESEFVVDVFDAGVDDAAGTPFLVMELLRGEELGARLKRAGRLSPGETVMFLHQTALGLDRMRAANVVHRDLKPENLFLTTREDGPPRVKVLDLGIAKVLAEGATGAQATRSLGTPLYMAPEQLESASGVTPAADLYALGMIAYTLLVGRPYFAEEAYESGNMLAFALVIRRGPTEGPELRAARGGVTLPPAFSPWFARATARSPEQRFPTAVSMIADLAAALGVASPLTGPAILAGLPASAGPGSAAAPASPPGATATSLSLTRNPPGCGRAVAPAAVAVAALVVLAGAISFVLLGRRPPAMTTATTPSTIDAPPAGTIAVLPAPHRVDAAPEPGGAASGAGAAAAVDAGVPPRAPPSWTAAPRQPAREREAPIYSRD